MLLLGNKKEVLQDIFLIILFLLFESTIYSSHIYQYYNNIFKKQKVTINKKYNCFRINNKNIFIESGDYFLQVLSNKNSNKKIFYSAKVLLQRRYIMKTRRILFATIAIVTVLSVINTKRSLAFNLEDDMAEGIVTNVPITNKQQLYMYDKTSPSGHEILVEGLILANEIDEKGKKYKGDLSSPSTQDFMDEGMWVKEFSRTIAAR